MKDCGFLFILSSLHLHMPFMHCDLDTQAPRGTVESSLGVITLPQKHVIKVATWAYTTVSHAGTLVVDPAHLTGYVLCVCAYAVG